MAGSFADALQIHSADISDGQGTFRVRSNGVIEVLSGYSNVGQVYLPGSAVYDQMVKNLASGANLVSLNAVLGSTAVAKSLSSSPLVSASGGGEATMEETLVTPIPFYQQSWFWPSVIGLAAFATVGGIVYSVKKK
jgi:hypothetical protein